MQQEAEFIPFPVECRKALDIPPGATAFQEKPVVDAGVGSGPGRGGEAAFRHFPLIKTLVVEIKWERPAPSAFLPKWEEWEAPAGSLSSFCRKP